MKSFEQFFSELTREVGSFVKQKESELFDHYKLFYAYYVEVVSTTEMANPQTLIELNSIREKFVSDSTELKRQITENMKEFYSQGMQKVQNFIASQNEVLSKVMLTTPNPVITTVPIYQESPLHNPLLDPNFEMHIEQYRNKINIYLQGFLDGLEGSINYLNRIRTIIEDCIQIWDAEKLFLNIENLTVNYKDLIDKISNFRISDEQLQKDMPYLLSELASKYRQLFRQYCLLILKDILPTLNNESYQESNLAQLDELISWAQNLNLETDYPELKLIINEIFNIRSKLNAKNIKGLNLTHFTNIIARINAITSIPDGCLNIIRSSLIESIKRYEDQSNYYKDYFKKIYNLYQALILDFKNKLQSKIKQNPDLDVYEQLKDFCTYSKFGLDVIEQCEKGLSGVLMYIDEESIGLNKGDLDKITDNLKNLRTLFKNIIENQSKIDEGELDTLQTLNEQLLNEQNIMFEVKMYNKIITDLKSINADIQYMTFN